MRKVIESEPEESGGTILWISWGKSVPGRGNSQCKDPEVSVTCSGDIKEVSVAAAEGGRP